MRDILEALEGLPAGCGIRMEVFGECGDWVRLRPCRGGRPVYHEEDLTVSVRASRFALLYVICRAVWVLRRGW